MSKELYILHRTHFDIEPSCVELSKETKQCYYIDNEVNLRFYKLESFKIKEKDFGVIGYNKYLWLFDNKQNADNFYKERLNTHKVKKCECCKIEFLLKDMKGDVCYSCYDFIEEVQRKGIAELKSKLKLTEKALELACNTARFEDTCDFCAYQGELEITKQCPCCCETDEKFFKTQAIGYFLSKAKEIIDNESNND